MSLPRSVAQAEELADRLHQEMLAAQQAPEGDTPTEQTTEQQTPVEQSDESVGIAPEPQPEPTDSTPTPATGADDQLEHRYRVLQGKYNSEVPRLSAENKDLKGRLQQIEQQLLELQAAKDSQPLVSQQEIDEYGEGLIDVARRVAREELATKDAEIKMLKSKLESLEETTTKVVQEDFFTSLGNKVSDWATINSDSNFHKWLGEIDDLTGARRQDLLSAAERDRDADRVAKFFLAFKKTSQKLMADANSALSSQVAPSSVQTPNTPPAKKVWTRGEISAFYARLRRGEVDDAEAVAIESDIQAASLEGRVR